MKYIKKLIRNSKRALNQQVIKNKQEIVKYAPRLTGIQDKRKTSINTIPVRKFQGDDFGPAQPAAHHYGKNGSVTEAFCGAVETRL